jgi:hypothetical protein
MGTLATDSQQQRRLAPSPGELTLGAPMLDGYCSVRRPDGGNAVTRIAGRPAATRERSRHRGRACAERILHAAARGLRRGVCEAGCGRAAAGMVDAA